MEVVPICYNATSSLLAGGFAFGVSAYVLRRNHPRLKWCGVALLGVTAMQWLEGVLWLEGPTPDGWLNRFLTVGVVPLVLLAQPWGTLFGSTFVVPVRGRRLPFFLLMAVGLVMVVSARWILNPGSTQVTPQGYLNWWAPQNPPVFSPWAFGLWAVVIGAPFLLWWRPFWQSVLIVFWGWFWAAVSFLFTDCAASHWCFFVSFYSGFVLVYSFFVRDPTSSVRLAPLEGRTTPDP